jgi:hypothetical protein
MMGAWLPETCREQININEKEMCVKLVIYKDYSIAFLGSSRIMPV